MGWFDVHAHLTHPKLSGSVQAVLARAREAGLTTIISNGLNPADNERVRTLAASYPEIQPAFGLYPVDAVLGEMRARGISYPRDEPACDPEQAVQWLRDNAHDALAVGEIGLDGYWVPEPLWPAQERIFSELVAIALAAHKPIIIHTRRREQRALDLLVEQGAERVVWHCFGGKVKLARRIAERGHWLSLPANAARSESFTRMLQTLPRDRLLLETDCPYLSPTPGAVNEPANVLHTVRQAAAEWSVDVDIVRAQLCGNFERVFGVAP